MKAKNRTRKLDSVVTIRLPEGHARRLADRAKQAGHSASEWCRQAILGCLDLPPADRLILEELMAVRIFLALQLDEVHNFSLSEDRLRSHIEQAETTKAAMAESRIHSMRSKSTNE